MPDSCGPYSTKPGEAGKSAHREGRSWWRAPGGGARHDAARGDQTAYRPYGLDLISQVEGTAATYYPYDALGSTRQLADDEGTVVATYEYDIFGALREKTGTADTVFRYTGEQWDAETDFYYLRARHYDPATGRFVSRDPWPGLVAARQSLNPYAYVSNNPVAFIDPFGLARERATPTLRPVRNPTPPCEALPGATCCYTRDEPRGFICDPPGPRLPEPPNDPWGWDDLASSLNDLMEPYGEIEQRRLEMEREIGQGAWDFASTRTPECYFLAIIEAALCTDPATWEACMLYAEPTLVYCVMESR